MLIDSHCHIDGRKFDGDRDEVIARMKENGIIHAVCVGDSMANSERSIALAGNHKGYLYAAVGVHPHEAKDFRLADLDRIKEWTQLAEVVGIGEIGLDYHYDFSPREAQKEAFIAQLDLASALQCPVIYHVREAHGDTISIMEEIRDKIPPGVMHCYGGSVESAKHYLDMGQYISFAGSVTFKNAHKLREVAKYVPLDRILVETDAPYLAPEPYRGKRNEPSFVLQTARHIADIREMDYEDFCRATVENTKRLFGI